MLPRLCYVDLCSVMQTCLGPIYLAPSLHYFVAKYLVVDVCLRACFDHAEHVICTGVDNAIASDRMYVAYMCEKACCVCCCRSAPLLCLHSSCCHPATTCTRTKQVCSYTILHFCSPEYGALLVVACGLRPFGMVADVCWSQAVPGVAPTGIEQYRKAGEPSLPEVVVAGWLGCGGKAAWLLLHTHTAFPCTLQLTGSSEALQAPVLHEASCRH